MSVKIGGVIMPTEVYYILERPPVPNSWTFGERFTDYEKAIQEIAKKDNSYRYKLVKLIPQESIELYKREHRLE